MPRPTPEDPAPPLRSAVAQILTDNRGAFLAFLERRVHDRALAEDLLQETLARALSRISELRDDSAVVAWFYRMLRNAVIDHRRRHEASGRALAAFAGEVDALATAPEPREGSACQCVLRLAETLKPEYATALQRIEVEGAPVKAFAEEQEISSSNAAVRVFRAREALRRKVAASCGACAEQGCRECTCAPAPLTSA